MRNVVEIANEIKILICELIELGYTKQEIERIIIGANNAAHTDK